MEVIRRVTLKIFQNFQCNVFLFKQLALDTKYNKAVAHDLSGFQHIEFESNPHDAKRLVNHKIKLMCLSLLAYSFLIHKTRNILHFNIQFIEPVDPIKMVVFNSTTNSVLQKRFSNLKSPVEDLAFTISTGKYASLAS